MRPTCHGQVIEVLDHLASRRVVRLEPKKRGLHVLRGATCNFSAYILTCGIPRAAKIPIGSLGPHSDLTGPDSD